MKKRLPKLKSDKEAEDFLNQDLSAYINKDNFRPSFFEFAPKAQTISLRLSKSLLDAIKAVSKRRKIPYQRYIREAIELALRK